MAMSVNMLRLRVLSEIQARSKNRQPVHSTTGVAKTNCTQFDACWPIYWWRLVRCAPISSTNTGAVSASAIQNRRVISASSGLAVASADAISGSSAMPQMGHEPGPSCRIWGCIGQV